MHTIRLRGPWNVEAIERLVPGESGLNLAGSTHNLPPGGRCHMPADWRDCFGAAFQGRAVYRRTFQKPTGLDEGQRVWLVVEPPRSRGNVTLNGELLGVVRYGDPPGRFEIAARIEDHNRLEIEVAHPALDEPISVDDDGTASVAGGLVGEVRLEIEEK